MALLIMNIIGASTLVITKAIADSELAARPKTKANGMATNHSLGNSKSHIVVKRISPMIGKDHSDRPIF